MDILSMDGLWQTLPFLFGIQIGPKIRIGGSVGKLGQKIKVGAGKVAKAVAPVAGFINPVLGAALGAGGAALDTSKGRVGIGDLAKGGFSGGGVSGALGAVGKLGKVGKVGGALGSVLGGVSKTPDFNPGAGDDYEPMVSVNGQMQPSLPDSTQDRFRPVNVAGGAPPQEQGREGWLQTALGFLSDHKDDILDYGTAAEQVADRYRRNKFQDEAVGMARGDLARRQPLRDMGMAGLLDQSRPDLSSVFNDPDNPVGRYRRVQVGSRI